MAQIIWRLSIAVVFHRRSAVLEISDVTLSAVLRKNGSNLSIARNTKFGERYELKLGFDLFNVFNTVNFANPNNDLQDAVDFGVITGTIGGPRVGQFRAKFRF